MSSPNFGGGERRPLRIEMVAPSLAAGGMEVVILDLVEALSARGHHVGVTCLVEEGALAGRFRDRGVRVEVVETPGTRTIVWPGRLKDWLKHEQVDVVHTHSGAWHKGARAARMAGVPGVIHTVHGLVPHMEPWFGVALRRLAGEWTDHVVVVSSPLTEFLTDVCGLSRSRVSHIANGIDVARFTPDPKEPPPIWPDLGSGIAIGSVARLALEKNQALLLEAFARIADEVPKAHLVVMGEGPERQALEARADRLGIRHRVHLPGFSSATDLIYPQFDIFTLTSNAEGTSISLLEAMACGRPIIATAVGGNPEILGHGEAGVLVPSRDPAALAAGLRRLLGDAKLRETIAARGRERVLASYSREAMATKYEELYYAARGSERASVNALAVR